jgi:hypothetical protein
MSMRVAMLAAFAAAVLAAPAQACPLPAVYPGDDAPKEQLSQWLAGGAIAAGLPGELPVMGALVESGVKNLDAGDSDTKGFFGMREAIWNTGPYAGFVEHPELQLQWFVDYALDARRKRLASGFPDPVFDENAWGEWIADVLRPAEQYRYRYQLRLGEARTLIGPPCGAASVPAPAPGGVPAPAPDVLPPPLVVGGALTQRALRRGAVVVEASCPVEACVASATATIRVFGRTLKLAARERALGAGQAATLRLALNARARAAVRRALRAHRAVRAKVRVTVADAAGNQTIAGRTVRFTG